MKKENLRSKAERLAELYRQAGLPRPVHTWDEAKVDLHLELFAGRSPVAAEEVNPEREAALAWRDKVLPRLERAKLPKGNRDEIASWRCEEQRKTFGVCRRKFRRVGSIVVLLGERGLGKTTIGGQLIIAEARAGYTAPYRKLSDLLKLKPLYTDIGTIEGKQLEAERDYLATRRLMVIDEVHEALDDVRVAIRILTDILDRRYANKVDTLLISNQKEQAFTASVDYSIISRILERGRIITCSWPNWRERIAKEAA